MDDSDGWLELGLLKGTETLDDDYALSEKVPVLKLWMMIDIVQKRYLKLGW